jgi:DNA-binding transcriptional ArsR family regulator
MESHFSIVAEPSRRAILSLLLASECSVGDIESQLSSRVGTCVSIQFGVEMPSWGAAK